MVTMHNEGGGNAETVRPRLWQPRHPWSYGRLQKRDQIKHDQNKTNESEPGKGGRNKIRITKKKKNAMKQNTQSTPDSPKRSGKASNIERARKKGNQKQ
jgi:hypothetical protein